MTGAELTVAGWFASSIIRNIIDIARSYLGNNYALYSGAAEMLTSLENSLPQIQAVIEVASKRPTTNGGLIRWMGNMKNAAYEVKDVLDDLEAKRFRECLKGKNKVTEFISSSGKLAKTLIFSDKELKGFKSAVEKFYKICKDGESFLNVLDHDFRANANKEHADIHRRETSSYLDPNANIFGRDIEIYSILDIILNYRSMYYSQGSSNQKLESQSHELPDQKEMKLASSFWGYRKILEKFQRAFEKGSTSEVKKEDKLHEKHNIGSNVGDRNLVHSRNWKLPVLPICGLGGVGKTTIAQIVYNNDIVTEVFDLRAWVDVSVELDVVTIMKKIAFSLEGGSSRIRTYSGRELVEKALTMTIESKRFFLVLDDVHDRLESMWTDLFSVLSIGAPGSFILVTTHSERVARTVGNLSIIINLDALEPEWFDLLFKSYAFGELFSFNRNSGKYSISYKNNAQFVNLREEELTVLESIASKIAKKLHGLPLAGRVIGKMLYSTLEKVHWENILKSKWWELDDEKTSKQIIASLKISYNDLGPELQQCFKFCSIFPKHYVFDRNTLVHMWLAHDFDFVQPSQQESFKLDEAEIRMEDVGGKRFDKLVQRSFFQATVSDGKYVMPDLIRELAIAVSSKQEFYHVESLAYKIPLVIHHMGINNDGSNGEEINPICTNLRTKSNWKSPIDTNFRTIIMFGNWINCSSESIINIFTKSKGIRLLDLSYIRIKESAPFDAKSKGLSPVDLPHTRIKENAPFGCKSKGLRPLGLSYFGIKKNALFDAICQQSHLRFVDLSFSGIDFIPDKFCELFHLQVLDVRGCVFSELPKGMNKLINLRHLYASASTVSKISGIGKLTNLQELEEFCIGFEEGHKISELRNMNEITGHLLISDLHLARAKDATASQLAKKKYLKSLELRYDWRNGISTSRVELEVLKALRPSTSVEMLTINSSISEYLPGWITSQCEASNLKYVKVTTFVNLTNFPAFGELPSLEVLCFDSLSNLKTVGIEFYGRNDVVFPSLKELHFTSMLHWRAWLDAPAGRKSFPCLRKLVLDGCWELTEIPTNFFTSSMVELRLVSCPNIHNIATILQRMSCLTHLSITKYCSNLSIYCTDLNLLEVMCLTDVKHLSFVGGLKSLVNLRKLEIMGFNEILESFDVEQENNMTSQGSQFLTYLHLDNTASCIQSLPVAGRFNYLRSFVIRNSPVIKYTEEEESWFNQLTSLETLEFSNCAQLKCLPSTLPLLTKLKKLTIVDCHKISSLPEFGAPENLSSLETLELSNCTNLTDLPSTLPLLTKLKKLTIKDCPMISSLPEFGLPPYLTELYITRCSDELVRRCQPDQGDDRWKISHIPRLRLDVE